VTILVLLVQLFSGAMLLLFSVRFMRIGIERLWEAQLRRRLRTEASIVGGLSSGAALGLLMQGATVVMLMAAGLAGSGAASVGSAAMLALGADLGSAFAVALLQLPISGIGPLALLLGATLYLRIQHPRVRNYGRVLLGLGLIFLSLTTIRAAVQPIAALEMVGGAASYLSRDAVAAAMIGVLITLAMHSSVAAILTGIAFVNHAEMGTAAMVGFVLGCNVGSALLPLWLLKGENVRARIVAMAVAGLRILAAVILILVVGLAREVIDALGTFAPGQMMLVAHLSFNAVLLPFAPVCLRVAKALESRLAPGMTEPDEAIPLALVHDGALATPAAKRKLSNMLDIAAAMLDEAMSGRPDTAKMLVLETRMNAALRAIREAYAVSSPTDEVAETSFRQIVDFAIRIERCGDVLAGKFLSLRLDALGGQYDFSPAGRSEIEGLVAAVRQTIVLAHETMWTEDDAVAERLMRQKQHVSRLEEESRHQHLARLRDGNVTSKDSSDQHLEVIAALKEINSKLATIAYAVLDRRGALRSSRLKSSAATSPI
jgi:phosphate:Na+ symporter